MTNSSLGNEYIRLPSSDESDLEAEAEGDAKSTSEKLQNGGNIHVQLPESKPGPIPPLPPNVVSPARRYSSEDGSEFISGKTLKDNESVSICGGRSCLSERVQTLVTTPHLIALLAFVLLIAYAAVNVRAENARQLKAEGLERRFAFVYLVTPNVTNIQHLKHSLKSLGKHFTPDSNYRIIVVHEGILPSVQGHLQSLIEAPLTFREYQLRGPRSLNLSKETFDSTDEIKWGYQNAIRFWFYTAVLAMPAKNDVLADLDYIVRLDSDTVLTGEISREIVRDFVLSGAQFGYQSIGKECLKNMTYGLKELAESYVELNGITPRSKNLWESVKMAKSGGCIPKFENHFEVINLRFFRSHSGIQDWIRVVDANGGIYRHGWGDATLRYITVALYAAPEKLIRCGVGAVPFKGVR